MEKASGERDGNLSQACAVSIILLRVKHNVRRAALARHLGITPYRLKRYEMARERPSQDIIEKLAGYFDVDADFFTCLANNPVLLGRFLNRSHEEILGFYES